MTTRHPAQLQATAYHEAGHAVAAFWHRLNFRHVTIEPGDDSLGHMLHVKLRDSFRPDIEVTPAVRDRLERGVVVCYAGPTAERKFTGRHNHVGAGGDRHNALVLGGYVGGEGKALEAYMRWLWIRAETLWDFAPRWKQVEAVAAGLLNRTTLTAREVQVIIRDDPTH
jgi:ATP-dependent Zn protease